MRYSRIFLVIVSAAIVFSTMHAVAQRTAPPVARARLEGPPPVFQTRSPAARLQTLRSLDGGEGVQPSQLMTPFSLTPRTTYVEGRGALSVSNADNLPMYAGAPVGVVRLHDLAARVTLNLVSPAPRRYLIDCSVSPGTTVGASAGSAWQAQSTSASAQGMQIVSFYTPPLPANTNIMLRDAEPEMIDIPASFDKWTGKTTPASQYYSGWRLSGCEVTPVNAP